MCDQIHLTALAGSDVKPLEISKNKIFRLCELTLNDTVGFLTKCSLWKGKGLKTRRETGGEMQPQQAGRETVGEIGRRKETEMDRE